MIGASLRAEKLGLEIDHAITQSYPEDSKDQLYLTFKVIQEDEEEHVKVFERLKRTDKNPRMDEAHEKGMKALSR